MSNLGASSQPSSETLKAFATSIARAHRDEEGSHGDIYVDWSHGEVRLLEVAEHYPDSTEVLPFHFSADPSGGFIAPVVIVLHSRQTWEAAEQKATLLPDGWNFDDFQHLDAIS